MSSSKPKAKSSVNEQVKAGIAALKDFLGGHAEPTDEPAASDEGQTTADGSQTSEEQAGVGNRNPVPADQPDNQPDKTGDRKTMGERESEMGEKGTDDRRPVTAVKTLAEKTANDQRPATAEAATKVVSPDTDKTSTQATLKADLDETVGEEKNKDESTSVEANNHQLDQFTEPDDTQRQSNRSAGDQDQPAQSNLPAQAQKRERQQRSVDDVSFEAAVELLRAAGPSADRADAARALGLQGSQRATPHLIAAMFDDDSDVRSAAEEALAQIGEPTFKQLATPEGELENSNMMQPPLNTSQQTSVSPAATGVVAQPPEKEGTHAQRKQKTSEQPHTLVKEVVHTSAMDAAASASKGATTRSEQRTQKESEPRPEQTSEKVHKLKTVAPATQATLDRDASEEEQQLLLEERAVRQRLELIVQQLSGKAAARKESENEVQWRLERESKLLADAAAQRAKEEESRKKAEEEAARRRQHEAEAIAAEQSARAKADAEAERLATAEVRLRNEIAKLNRAAEELEQRRKEAETARLSAAAAARQAEAQHARDEADRMHKAELERLRNDQAMLQAATEKAAARRAEVDVARERAEKDAEALAQARARMREAEDARIKAEAERVKLEAELHLKVETEEALLAQAKQRARDEQARLEEEARRHRESEEKRLADLEESRMKAEFEAKQRAEREQQIRSQLDTLRIADADVRKRIEEGEVRRRAAEEAFRLVADKVQRVEAEAHAGKLEEEQILAKLEVARRNAAVEAQGRTEQERRIKEEIEMFRRLEDEERPRLEELILQRSDAEARLQQARERFKSEEEARVRAEEQIETLREYRRQANEQQERELTDDTVDIVEPSISSVEVAHAPVQFVDAAATAPSATATVEADIPVVPAIPAAISSYLHSVDPYKRAAAVAELARSQAKDAFALIAGCFDDHSPHVRNAAARALRRLEPHKSVDLFNRALEEASADRRKNIGSAIAASGLANDAIDNLISENREETYNALSILFVMAKTGEVRPLVEAIEEHTNEEVCRAVIKLLTLSGQSELGDAALQRRVMGVAASRQKAAEKHDEIPDFRLRIAEVEVKRALNSQTGDKSEK